MIIGITDYSVFVLGVMRKKETESPLDFLKGNDLEFNAAMESINDMYSDLFKTIDFQEGTISNYENL